MQELTTVSTSSSLTTSGQSSPINLAQPLLTALGWKDLKPAIVAAEQADQVLAVELQQAYDAYSKTPDDAAKHRLQMVLDQVIGELQADLARVKKLEKEAAKRLAKPQINSSSYLASWGSWIKQGVQTFFGSDDASLVERYAGIAQQRQESITALSRLREGLATQITEEQILASTAEQEPIEDVISPASRRLLGAETPLTVGQYCYSNGRCDLSNLYDGLSGFVLQGEASGAKSGYSVSSVGDINGDGFDDIVIGAYQAYRGNGESYVVFGSSQTNAWDSGMLNLTSLMDGQHGFALQGEADAPFSGCSVSSAGDVNGDGLGDMLVGAGLGLGGVLKAYVVFGSNQANAWGSGVLTLASLMDGQRGFGLKNTAESGISVSSAGDINGDSLDDILIGSHYAKPNNLTYAGKTYVVFGSNQTNAWGSGNFNLTDLINGQRGLMLQGEAAGDQSGQSVSTAGDINGDGLADILVGAYRASGSAGKTYVVFGTHQTNAWGSGTLNLTSLIDGQRGFVLQGEATGDYSGFSVSSAGDINGDNLTDMLVGAYDAGNAAGLSRAGKSYVVFGTNQTNAWGSGTVNLISLINGQRGFVLQGEVVGDYSGYSVSSAGDINGDGLADVLVGAYQADPSNRTDAGKTYVVFGSSQVNAWSSGTLNLTSLIDGQRGFVLQGEATGDYSGFSVSSAGDVNDDGFADVLVGAYGAAPVNRTNAGNSYVIFGSALPQLWANQMAVYRGQTLTLNAQNLNVTDGRPVSFTIPSITHGQFEYVSNPSQAITSFSQSQVWSGQVRFVHDGTSNAPSYSVQFGTGIAKMPPQNATIDFYAFGNSLIIHQGESLQMSDAYLDIVVGYPADQVNITISNLQHGAFLLAPSNVSISQFVQTELLAGNILFAHDGSALAPGYNVTVTDPSRTLVSAADVTFYRRPLWVSNQLTLTQGDQVLLGNRHINVTEDQPDNNVLFTVGSLQHGQFRLTASNNTLTQFTQQQLLAGQVLFVHDKTGNAPSYQLTLNDSYFVLPPFPATINFTALPPVLGNNRLAALQGQAITLSETDLNATDPDPVLSDNLLMFSVSNVQYGKFTLNGSSTALTQFSQAQIAQGQVVFIHNDSTSAPSYQVAASNPFRGTVPTAASITFDKRPVMINNRLTVETGESVVLALTNLQAVDDHTASADLVFTVSDVNRGFFSALQAPDVSITSFLQQQVRDSEIQFQHDGSPYAPSYTVKARDNVGLDSIQTSSQIKFTNTLASGGINWQAVYASASTIGGVILSVAGYLWWRRRVASHRRGYDFANDLRKAANLEYHDFMVFDGEVYKTKINTFVAQLKLPHSDFYDHLTPAEKKSFAVCVAETLQNHKLLAPSDCGDALYGWFFGFSVGWSRKLDVKAFEKQVSEIAREAVAAWQAEEHPLTRWPYQSPTYKDKAKAWCCPRPSKAGMFTRSMPTSPRSEQGVQLEDMKHSVPSSPSGHQKSEGDVVISMEGRSASSRFFSSSAGTSEERLGLIEKQVQNIAGNVQRVSEKVDSVAGNVKTIHDEVEQLKTETRPLLGGMSSSTASY